MYTMGISSVVDFNSKSQSCSDLVLEANLAQQAARSTARIALFEDTEQALPDSARLLAGVDALPDASLLVVVDDRTGLVVVGSQALLKGIGVVVGSLDKRFTGDIVSHGVLRRVENLVVGAAGCRVNQTASDSGNKELIVNAELDGVLEGHLPRSKHLVEALGLGNCAREPVKDESKRTCPSVSRPPNATAYPDLPVQHEPVLALVVVLELVLDHVDHDLVADQTTLVHNLLGLTSQLGLLCDLGAEHVTGGLEMLRVSDKFGSPRQQG